MSFDVLIFFVRRYFLFASPPQGGTGVLVFNGIAVYFETPVGDGGTCLPAASILTASILTCESVAKLSGIPSGTSYL